MQSVGSEQIQMIGIWTVGLLDGCKLWTVGPFDYYLLYYYGTIGCLCK